MLTQGIIRRIGRGETTNIWSMNWLPRDDQPRLQHLVPKCTTVGSRVDLPTYSIVGSTEATSLFLSNGCRGNQFHPIDHQVTDFWAWHYERRGFFSVRSAYKMLVNDKQRTRAWLEDRSGTSDTRATEKEWLAIWKVNVPAKIRVFLWRLARHSL